MNIKLNLNDVKQKLIESGLVIANKIRLPNNGWQLHLTSGAVVNVFDTSKINYQCRNAEEVEKPSDIVRKYEWDESKRAANIAKHGVDFDAVNGFVWRTAIVKPSPRSGEMRFAATGYIGERAHRLIFTWRGWRIRIISLRRASRQEVQDYERRRTQSDGYDL